MNKWERVGWILLGILTGLLWLGVCYAEAPNFDGTIALTVDGDSQFQSDVQQFVWQALRQKGYNVILSGSRDGNSPYKSLEVKIKKNSGRTDYGSSSTPNYVPSFNVNIGGHSQSINLDSSSSRNTTTHYDEMSVMMTIWQGNNAISSSTAVVPVVWREANTSYYNNSKRQSEEGFLTQGALEAAAKAFNQLALSPVSTRQVYSGERIDLIIVQLVRKGNDGQVYYRVGTGRTLEEAFQSALKAEEKILKRKKSCDL